MFGKEWNLRRKTGENEIKDQTAELVQENVHTIPLSEEVVRASEEGNITLLVDTVRGELQSIGFNESELLFRGIRHPKDNITAMLVNKYGTDRFEGFSSGNIPSTDDGLVPYRNKGEIDSLTADTYAVPELKWGLAHIGLATAFEIHGFRTREFDSFLLLYDRSCIKSERTPTGGGELWRATFLKEPRDALQGIVYFVPPKE